MKRIVLASLLILCGMAHASAETDVFKDVRSPAGHARSQAVKTADFRACGASNHEVSNTRFPAAVQCMSSRGWAIARIERDPPPPVQPDYHGPSVTVTIGAGPSDDDRGPTDEQMDAMEAAGLQDMQNVIDAAAAANAAAMQ
jgi:hypothetical protein